MVEKPMVEKPKVEKPKVERLPVAAAMGRAVALGWAGSMAVSMEADLAAACLTRSSCPSSPRQHTQQSCK